MVQAQIRRTQEAVIPGHLDTLDMGSEISVRYAAQSFMEDLVGDAPYRAVLIE